MICFGVRPDLLARSAAVILGARRRIQRDGELRAAHRARFRRVLGRRRGSEGKKRHTVCPPYGQSAVYAASVQPERRSSDAIIAWRRRALHALENLSENLSAVPIPLEYATSERVNPVPGC
jgi:hypothetical protein